MTFFSWLRDLLFGPPEPRPESLEFSPNPIKKQSDGEEIIEISLHTTETLYENNGRIPEQMVARQLQHALDKTKYGYTITFNYPVFVTRFEKSVCGDQSTFHEWRDADDRHTAKDSNVLLCNTRGGGCGAVGGKVATTAGGAIDRLVLVGNRAPEDGGRLYRNLSGNLHEIGHNLGLGHDMDDADGKQHTGRGWNEADYWHRTPMNVANGVDNLCGEHIPTRQHQAVVPELYYHDCSVEHFDTE